MVEDFDTWYAEAHPVLSKALTAWCGDASVAADALDEAFVRAIERWDRVRVLDAPSGWVWRTATNVARRRVRRGELERRALRRRSAGAAESGPGPTGDDVDLRRGLDRLSERQRTAIVLRYVVDLSQREIGTLMGIAEGTVAATLHQARARLADHLTATDGLAASPSPRTDGASP